MAAVVGGAEAGAERSPGSGRACADRLSGYAPVPGAGCNQQTRRVSRGHTLTPHVLPGISSRPRILWHYGGACAVVVVTSYGEARGGVVVLIGDRARPPDGGCCCLRLASDRDVDKII